MSQELQGDKIVKTEEISLVDFLAQKQAELDNNQGVIDSFLEKQKAIMEELASLAEPIKQDTIKE